jgi:hypothetical protein
MKRMVSSFSRKPKFFFPAAATAFGFSRHPERSEAKSASVKIRHFVCSCDRDVALLLGAETTPATFVLSISGSGHFARLFPAR